MALKGIPLSEEHKRKISLANLGKVGWNKGKHGVQEYTAERNRKISESRKGSKHSIITRQKMREAKLGEKAPAWKGGITPINKLIRESLEYRLWREAVFERDDYRCLYCGERGGRLNADHIYKFAEYPRLRFELENGQTLCEPCHRKTPNYGTKNQEIKCT